MNLLFLPYLKSTIWRLNVRSSLKKKNKTMLEERETFTINRHDVQAAEKNNPRLWMRSVLPSLNIS